MFLKFYFYLGNYFCLLLILNGRYNPQKQMLLVFSKRV